MQENRINYNQRDYQAVFADEQSKEVLNQSEKEASLFDLVMVTIYLLNLYCV